MSITDTQLSGSHVWHIGELAPNVTSLEPGQRVRVNFTVKNRIELMQNHTGTHLLNAALHELFPYTSQKSSSVTPLGFRFDFVTLNATFNGQVSLAIEQKVSEYINKAIDIERLVIQNPEATFETESLQQAIQDKYLDQRVITMKDEFYPSKVALINIPSVSVEPCCGTHLVNTSDVLDFVIVSVKSTHPGQKSLKCLTGQNAVKARQLGLDMIEEAVGLSEFLDESQLSKEELDQVFAAMNHLTKKLSKDMPLYIKEELQPLLKEMAMHLRTKHKQHDANKT